MKNILINKEMFTLDENNKIGESGYSGSCYRLKTDTEDLAVKLYRTKRIESSEDPWFPRRKTLEYFTTISSCTSPIIISKYLVEDENEKYIGCASSYIDGNEDTEDVLLSLPVDTTLGYFDDIISTTRVFNDKGVALDDWNTYNTKLGKVSNSDATKLYMFDDSSYRLSKHAQEDNELIPQDFIENFVTDVFEKSLAFRYLLDDMRRHTDYIEYLSSASKGYACIKEFLTDYDKTITKKYCL